MQKQKKLKKAKKEKFKLNYLEQVKNNIINFLKKLTPKNYFNVVLLLLILLSATYVFFQYKLIFFPDSQVYYSLSEILLGKVSLNLWDTVRGFGFPLIIMFWIKLFGDTSSGLLIGCFTFYLFLILGIGYLLQKFIKINEIKNKGIFFFLYLLVVVFNPLIIGYSHTLLTEAVIPALYLLTVFLCLKWYKINYKEHRKTYIILNAVFILLSILIWFIKQPYAPAYYAALLITAIFSAIFRKSWKEFGKRMITIGLCLIFMGISIFSWDRFISNYASSANSANAEYLNEWLIGGLSVFNSFVDKEISCKEEYIQNVDISEKDREKVIKIIEDDKENWCSRIHFFEQKDRNENHLSNEILITKDGDISFGNSLLFLIKMYIKHPRLAIKSYFYNYLAIADIQERNTTKGNRSSLEYSPYIFGENLSNGTYALTVGNDTVIDNPYFARFNQKTTPQNVDLMNILLINNTLCFYLYKILILISFPVFIYAFIKYLKNKNVNYFIISLLSMISFADAFFHTFMGAIIDRYVYPVYPLMLLCLFILFMEKKVEK